jgi:competence protein ComEC
MPDKGNLWVNVLDVGQGLSVVLRTTHHVLVYDTGNGPPLSDMGETVIVPFLHSQGIQRIDKIVISHGDLDHRGGLESLLTRFPGTPWVSGDFLKIHTNISVHTPQGEEVNGLCHQGQTWSWDGVQFTFLWPPFYDKSAKRNNRSCVLLVETPHNRLLLTGDIEKEVEAILKKDLKNVDLLLAPHHGSRTSSSPGFIAATLPRNVVFSTGWCNHYHFPNKKVVSRYNEAGSTLFNTATQGQLWFELPANGAIKLMAEGTKRHWWEQRNCE